jgi:subfamily B ATP-binding cassette protein MsbA
MDEPTSAVDQEKETAISQALQRLQIGRTAFTISHRLSFIEGYDVVMKLEQGRLLNAPTADAR